MSSVNVVYDTKYPSTMPVPTRPRYEFLGWFDSPRSTLDETAGDVSIQYYNENGNFIVENVENIPTYKTAGDTKLYAHWKAKTYTASFNMNCQNSSMLLVGAPSAQSVSEEQNFQIPIPESMNVTGEASERLYRRGYTFEGWYPTPECDTAPFDFSTQLNNDIILYAKWKPVSSSCMVNVSFLVPSTEPNNTDLSNNPNYYSLQGGIYKVVKIEDDICLDDADKNVGWESEAFPTDENGRVSFDRLTFGKYQVIEVSPPPGGTPMSPDESIYIIFSPDDIEHLQEQEISSVAKSGTLSVQAVIQGAPDVLSDTSAEAIAGIEFAVYHASDVEREQPVEVLVTERGGNILSTQPYLFGDYIVVQRSNPTGFVNAAGAECFVSLLEQKPDGQATFELSRLIEMPATGQSGYISLILIAYVMLIALYTSFAQQKNCSNRNR